MKTARAICLATLTLVASACDLATRPRDFAIIGDIEVPDSIGRTDSLVVSFTYRSGLCDTDIAQDVIAMPGLRSYSVLLRHPEGPANCPDVARISQPIVYTIPSALRADPFTIQFRGPGNIETRTVTWR